MGNLMFDVWDLVSIEGEAGTWTIVGTREMEPMFPVQLGLDEIRHHRDSHPRSKGHEAGYGAGVLPGQKHHGMKCQNWDKAR
jgi:hypothetical protein